MQRRMLSSKEQDDFVLQLQELQLNGKWAETLEILEQMDRAGAQLDSSVYSHAIKACAKGEQFGVVLGLYENMKQDQVVPAVDIVDLLLDSFMICDKEENAIDLLDTMYQNGTMLSLDSYRRGMEACRKLKDSTTAIKILNQGLDADLPLCDSDFVTAINICGRAHDFQSLRQLSSKLQREGHLSAPIVSELVRQLMKKDSNAARNIILSTPSEVELHELIYAEVMIKCCGTREFDAVARLYHHCEATRDPSVFLKRLASLAYAETGRETQVEKMKETGALFDNTRLSSDQAQTLLNVYQQTRRFADFYDLYTYAIEQDLPLYGKHHGSAIFALSQVGKFDEAAELYYARLKSSRVAAPIFLSMLAACAVTDKVPVAFIDEVWETTKQNVQTILSPLYASVLRAYAAGGHSDRVDAIIVQESLEDDVDVLCGALKGYESSGKYDEMLTLLSQMDGDDILNHDIAVEHFVAALLYSGDLKALKAIHTDVFKMPYDRRRVICGRIMRVFSSRRDWKQLSWWSRSAKENEIFESLSCRHLILENMANSKMGGLAFALAMTLHPNVPRSSTSYSAAMSACYNSEMYSKVARLYFQNHHCGADLRAKKLFIKSGIAASQYLQAKKVADNMLASELQTLDEEAYGTIIDLYDALEDYESVFEIWKATKLQGIVLSSDVVLKLVRALGQYARLDDIAQIRNDLVKEGREISGDLSDEILSICGGEGSLKVLSTALMDTNFAEVNQNVNVGNYLNAAEELKSHIQLGRRIPIALYENIQRGLLSHRNAPAAVDLFVMACDNSLPIRGTVSSLINNCFEQREFRSGLEVMQYCQRAEIDVLSHETVSAVLSILTECEQYDELADVLARDFGFDAQHFSVALKKCCHSRAWRQVVAIFRGMPLSATELDTEALYSVVQACERLDDKELVRNIVDHHLLAELICEQFRSDSSVENLRALVFALRAGVQFDKDFLVEVERQVESTIDTSLVKRELYLLKQSLAPVDDIANN